MNKGTHKVDATYFSAGDEVPEWLLSQTPCRPRAKKCKLTFASPVAVVEVFGRYYVMPEGDVGETLFAMSDGDDLHVGSPAMPVLLIIRAVTINPPWVEGKTMDVRDFNAFVEGRDGE